MARVVVLQHGAERSSGRLGMTLRDHGFKLDIRRVDLPTDQGGAPVPTDLDDVQGVVCLGGPQNVGDNHPWLAREREFLAAAHEAALPVVGICLGAQLLASALGGSVGPMPGKPEFGYRPIRIAPPGQTEVMLAGIPWEWRVFQTHAQEITEAPPGAQVLASSDDSKVQIFKAGHRSYGFQFHFEYDRAMVDRALSLDSDLMVAADCTAEQIRKQADEHHDRFAQIADRLCLNLASYCFPFSSLLSA